MKTLTSLSILFFTLFMSCDETKKVLDVAGNVQLSGNYTITSVAGKNATPNTLTISFTALDKAVRGNTGCNSFFGNYILDLYALSFGALTATEQYCDEPIMVTERAFMKALGETGSYTIENKVLTLYSKTDRSVLLKAKRDTTQEN